ncbi:hypothetical protein Agub_g8380, partial [Astrephomene gubernaculifera]
QRAWDTARAPARLKALVEIWSSTNRWLTASTSGAPMRHRHQQEILDLVDEHLTNLLSYLFGRSAVRPPPLRVILSTPTGSGKTFTAVMLQLQVLKGYRAAAAAEGGGGSAGGGSAGGSSAGGRGGGAKGKGAAAAATEEEKAAEQRQGHPEAILVYSVPTKQVLKRVGQECEAHGVIYWTAASDGELFQVRRPYSIRTKRGDKGSVGAGSMRSQLEECALRGSRNDDLGGGKPDVIIADIFATAELVRAAREAPPGSFYHSHFLVLYLDEPNMGLHLNEEVRKAVRAIMSAAPSTTILASATLPSWQDLPAWWRGVHLQQQQQQQHPNQQHLAVPPAVAAVLPPPTSHVVITQEPYELPTCTLSVYDSVSGQLVAVPPLELFDDAGQLAAALERSARLRVLLLRHFSG